VADAAWQAITSWSHRNKDELLNSIHRILPQRRKDKFKASGVKKVVPIMDMVHHQDVMVELSTHLLAAQREIESLRTQLWNLDATIQGYKRMIEG
jgi:DNA-binding transcriptional regulator PaaX